MGIKNALLVVFCAVLLSCSDPPVFSLKTPRAILLPNRALVTVGPSNQVRRWNPAGTQPKELFAPQDNATSSILSDEQSVVVFDSAGATLIDGAETYAPISLKNMVPLVAVYNNQGDVFSLDENAVLQKWQFDQKGEQVQLEKSAPTATLAGGAFSKDGRLLVVWEARSSIARVFDVQKAMFLAELNGHSDALTSVAFSQDPLLVGTAEESNPLLSQIVTASMDGTVRIWKRAYLPGWYMAEVLPGHQKGATYVSTSAVAKEIVTADGTGVIRFWQDGVQSGAGLGRLKQVILGHTGRVDSVVFSADGTEVASASRDGTARRWSKTQEMVTEVKADPICDPKAPPYRCPFFKSSAMNAAATLLVTANDAAVDNLQLWDIGKARAGRADAMIKKFGDVGPVNELVMSVDGRWLAVLPSTGNPWIWDVANVQNPQKVSSLNSMTPIAKKVQFSSDGKKLAGIRGMYVQLWDISQPAQPQLFVEFKAHDIDVNFFSFSQDGLMMITAGADGTAKIWGLSTPAAPTLLGAMVDQPASVTAAAFSPDTTYAVTGDVAGNVSLWDTKEIQNPGMIKTWKAYSSSLPRDPTIQTIVFSPKGDRFVVGSKERYAKVWDVQTQQALSQAFFYTFINGSNRLDVGGEGNVVMLQLYDVISIWTLPSFKELVKISL